MGFELLGEADRDEDEEDQRPKRPPERSWRNEFGLKLKTRRQEELPAAHSDETPSPVQPPDYDLELFRQRPAGNPPSASLASPRLLMGNINYLLSGTLDFAECLALASGGMAHYNNLREDRARRDHELQELYDQLIAMQDLQGDPDEHGHGEQTRGARSRCAGVTDMMRKPNNGMMDRERPEIKLTLQARSRSY